MNNTPPDLPTQKKGPSGLAMAGIGCGGLLLIAMVGAGLLVLKGCQKAQEMAADFQKNPAKAAAMFALKANPDVEVVSADDAKGEITIKDKKSGEVTTLSFNDISQGRISMKNSKGEEMSIDASGAKDGKVVMKGPNGQTVIGAGAAEPAPSWVPAYPGMKSDSGALNVSRNDKKAGIIMSYTTDDPAKVKDFYESQLKAAGFQTEAKLVNVGNLGSGNVKAEKAATAQKVTIVITGENGRTSIATNYEEPMR
jgi:hypothetical protein